MPTLIETRNLKTNFYTYEGVVKALNDVSIVVDHGITFGLVGESGCGKSVTVRSMMRIIQEPGKVEGGKVLFFPDKKNESKAVDLLEQSESYMEKCRGDQISMIFQEPNAALNPIMSIGDQVAESFLFHRKESMYKKISEELELTAQNCFSPFTKYLQKIYKLASGNPDSIILKILSSLPILKLWEKKLHGEALQLLNKCREGTILKIGLPSSFLSDLAIAVFGSCFQYDL
ncbi:MAG: ABC transporter ATP-binding protein [Desulfobacteraceae bacterium]|nr:ABC transporter ATP-binding protein [Desulfobacteraceae bacterium]